MKKVIVLFALTILSHGIFAQHKDDYLDPVIEKINAADASGLATFFSMTVELKLPDHEGTFSASQGEMIMKDFFKKYPPDSFSAIQKGTTDNISRFAICEYFTGSSKYQVYLYMRKDNEKFLVQKIKFEVKK